MNRFRSIALVGALAVLAVPALAADATGKWTGKIEVKLPTLPPNAPPAAKAQIEAAMKQLASARIFLVIKKGGTYTSSSQGLPTNQSSDGKWSLKGTTLTLVPNKKPQQGPPSQDLVLSKDGKTLTLVLPSPGGQGGGKITFTKG